MRIVTTVLGESREAKDVYPDGSFNCPFCWYAVQAPNTQCANPWCQAHPSWTPEALRIHLAKIAAQQAEEDQRKRNHELAMQRIAEDNQARREREDAERAEVIAKGACLRCWARNGKIIKHRAECPRERASIYRDMGMRKVRGALGGVYYE